MAIEDDPYVADHPQSRPFWKSAADGVLLLPRCRACGRAHWYPRPFCPHCSAGSIGYEPASGRGTVYAFSSLRRVVPENIVAYVRLDEGPTMLTNLVECHSSDLKIGDVVQVTFRAAKEGRMVPVFIPVLSS